jgi:hypothetical protein
MGLLSIIPEIPAIPEGLGNLENLGNLVSGFSVEEIIGKAGAYFNGLIAKLVAMIPPSVMALYNTHKVVFLLAAICLLVLVAYEGHRFFKMVTYAGSAFLFGLIGFWYLSPALEATLRPMIPPILDYHVTVAVACAVIAVLLCKFA